MYQLSKYLYKLRSNTDHDKDYEIEKFLHKVEYEIKGLRDELRLHQIRSQNLTEFLTKIEDHPSLQTEWKRFRLLYKTIVGNEPPLTK